MEGGQNFYIYLSSRENISQFPHNSPTSFTNLMKPTLSINSNYEVTLANIIYPNKIVNIKKDDPLYSIDIIVNYFNPNNRHDNKFVQIKNQYKPRVNICAKDTYDLINQINSDLTNFLKIKSVIQEKQKFIFKYKKGDSIVNYFGLDILPEVGMRSEYSLILSENLE